MKEKEYHAGVHQSQDHINPKMIRRPEHTAAILEDKKRTTPLLRVRPLDGKG